MILSLFFFLSGCWGAAAVAISEIDNSSSDPAPPAPGNFVLVGPPDTGTTDVLSLRPTFTWANATGETGYIVEVSDSLAFGNSIVFRTSVLPADTTVYTMPEGFPSYLNGGTTYYWRVFALNGTTVRLASNQPYSFTPKAGPWSKSFDGYSEHNGYTLLEGPDESLIILGEVRFSSPSATTDISFVKLNNDSSIAWQKALGGGDYDTGRALAATSDGGYIVAGNSLSYGANGDVLVTKLTGNGALEWQRAYGMSSSDQASGIHETAGGYFVVGSTFSAGTLWDVWVLKLDTTGGIIWEYTYGDAGEQWAEDSRLTADGGLIMTGSEGATPVNDVMVMKVDQDGNIDWANSYPDTGQELGYDITPTSDDGYLVVGRSDTGGAGGDDGWVLKLRTDRTVEWQFLYGGLLDDQIDSVIEVSDGYVLAGGQRSFTAGVPPDAWAFKILDNGDLSWEKSFGFTLDDWANRITPLSGGGFALCGRLQFGPAVDQNWTINLNADGTVPNLDTTIGMTKNTSATSDNALTYSRATSAASMVIINLDPNVVTTINQQYP